MLRPGRHGVPAHPVESQAHDKFTHSAKCSVGYTVDKLLDLSGQKALQSIFAALELENVRAQGGEKICLSSQHDTGRACCEKYQFQPHFQRLRRRLARTQIAHEVPNAPQDYSTLGFIRTLALDAIVHGVYECQGSSWFAATQRTAFPSQARKCKRSAESRGARRGTSIS
eukprot:3316566-Prymnesium_polylepis.1